MTEISAFREVMRMIDRNMETRRTTTKDGGRPRSNRRLLALVRAANCMVEISGCRRGEEAIFAVCADDVKRLNDLTRHIFPEGMP